MFVVIDDLLYSCQTLLELLCLKPVFLVLEKIGNLLYYFAINVDLCFAAHLFAYVLDEWFDVLSAGYTILHHHSASVVLV